MSSHIKIACKWGVILGGIWGFCFSPSLYSNEEELKIDEAYLADIDFEGLDTIDYLVDQILSEECLAIYDPSNDEQLEEDLLAYQECEAVVDDAFLTASLENHSPEPKPLAQTCSSPCPTYYCPSCPVEAEQPSRWSRFCSLFCCESPRIGSTSHRLFPYIRANAGRGIGFDCDYTTLGAMYTTMGCLGRFQPFIDIKWHCFTDRKNAANAGIGVRYLSYDCNLIFGGNVYYDYRDGCFADYHQLGLGCELLSKCFEFRVNGYFPFQDEGCRHKTIFDDYIGNFFVSCQRCDFTLKGADAEAGAVLFQRCGFRVLLAAGAYYYNNCFNHHALGARGRLNIRYCNHVGFDLYATTDKVFRNRVQGQFYICLPFSCFSPCSRDKCCQQSCNPLCCVACQPVYRNDMIVLKQGCCWDFNFDDTIGREEKKGCSCGCGGCH